MYGPSLCKNCEPPGLLQQQIVDWTSGEGSFRRIQRQAQEEERYTKIWTQQCIWHSERHSQKRAQIFAQSFLESPLSWFRRRIRFWQSMSFTSKGWSSVDLIAIRKMSETPTTKTPGKIARCSAPPICNSLHPPPPSA